MNIVDRTGGKSLTAMKLFLKGAKNYTVQSVPLGIRATAEYKVSQDTESDTLGSDFAGLNTIERKINHTPSGGW